MSLFKSFAQTKKRIVWEKGRIILGKRPDQYRLDDYGNVIEYFEYGNRGSLYGWEIDHHIATSVGGTNSLGNLRPLNCRTNARLGGFLGQFFKK